MDFQNRCRMTSRNNLAEFINFGKIILFHEMEGDMLEGESQ